MKHNLRVVPTRDIVLLHDKMPALPISMGSYYIDLYVWSSMMVLLFGLRKYKMYK